MKIFLAGVNYLHRNVETVLKENNMKIFLAGQAPWKYEGLYDLECKKNSPYILESFYYADSDTERLLPYYGDFLLDSGAFTFRLRVGSEEVDWIDYIERYAAWINKNKVEKFFELDIDNVVGYKKVIEYRRLLEKLTNRQPIPVWHIPRGKEEFIRSCEEYPYVALGGIVGGVITSVKYQQYRNSFPWFIKTAHSNNAKIHGLGFTSFSGIERCHFDSVDSTAWTTGNRFGYAWKFNGKTIVKVEDKSKKIKDPKALALHNFKEWIKFQQYADTHL